MPPSGPPSIERRIGGSPPPGRDRGCPFGARVRVLFAFFRLVMVALAVTATFHLSMEA